jgi:integrase
MADRHPTGTARTRKSTGGVVAPSGRRKSWSIRFRAYGRRHTLALGRPEDGWNRTRAEEALADVLAEIRLGTWEAPRTRAEEEAAAPATVPGFREFATDWLDDLRPALRPTTITGYEWCLSYHLLRHFRDLPVDAFTIDAVDRYRTAKLREGRLSASSVNKTLIVLAAILEVAVERGHLPRNPARGRRRRAKVTAKPRRDFLEPAQVPLLLDAAGATDAVRSKRTDDPGGRRTLLATLTLAGLRVGEAVDLRWRAVDLASGRLTVEAAKTAAGERVVDLSPALRDELAVHKAGSEFSRPSDLVFCTRNGRPLNRHAIRSRTLHGAIEKANKTIKAEGLAVTPLPAISPHALRRTFATLLVETGATPSYVMAQLGHTDPKVTLSIYAQALQRKAGSGEALDALVAPSDQAISAVAPPHPTPDLASVPERWCP